MHFNRDHITLSGNNILFYSLAPIGNNNGGLIEPIAIKAGLAGRSPFFPVRFFKRVGL